MKKLRGRIGLAVLSIVVLICGVILWQKNNLIAVYNGLKYSEVEIEKQVADTKKQVEDALAYYELGETKLGGEGPQAEAKGEVQGAPKGESKGETRAESTADKGEEGPSIKENTKATAEEKAIVAHYTKEMYSLQGKYEGLIGGLEASGREALRALPKEQRTLANFKAIGMPYVNKALKLESTCDKEVEQILTNLQNELREIGGSEGIVGVMRQAYYTEKQLKKGYYIAQAKGIASNHLAKGNK